MKNLNEQIERINQLSNYEVGVLLSEQDMVNDKEMVIKGESFFGDGKWKNLSKEGLNHLFNELKKMRTFIVNNKSGVVYIKIIAGESQVTNYDSEVIPKIPVEPRYLSLHRADTIKKVLTKWFKDRKDEGLINEVPIFEAPEVVIGSNSYVKGVDNPDDKKYVPERFVKVEVKIKSPYQCIVGLTVEVMYNKTYDPKFPCRGGHKCDEAKFQVNLNGVSIGIADLNNGSSPDFGGNRTSGKLIVDDSKAKSIIGDKSKNIIISLKCLSGGNCHSSTPEVRISKGNTIIYHQCSPSINDRGETQEKTILVLDNCGNLLQKSNLPAEEQKKGDDKKDVSTVPQKTLKSLDNDIKLITDLVTNKTITGKGNYFIVNKMFNHKGTQFNVNDIILNKN